MENTQVLQTLKTKKLNIESRFESTKTELQAIVEQQDQLKTQATELINYQKTLQGEYKAITELMEEMENTPEE